MTQVFISYSRKDLAFVERLANDLQAAGLEVWYDLSGLDGGTRWGREIQSAIAVWGIPSLAARLAPTPTPTTTTTHTPIFTLTAKSTHTPTRTFTPTFTPTETTLPTVTIDPTTGVVTGTITWASQPFEGVTVKLCTDWLFTCKGREYIAITDAQGVFIITGVEPGNYQLITKEPDQAGETRVNGGEHNWPITIEVSGGQAVDLGGVTVCKHDLFIIRTIQGSSVTFSWKAYPGATGYYAHGWESSSGYTFGPEQTSSTSFSTNLGTGNYEFSVYADGPDGLCAQGMIKFTIP
jgi:hypothetical protein